MSYNTVFFYVTLTLYFFSASLFTAYLIMRRNYLFSYFKQWLLIASISGAFFFLIRYRESGYLPLVTLFEITFFYAWITTIVYIIFVKKEMARFIQGVTLLIIYALLIWNIFMDKGIYPLNPLLNSFWLGIHVPTAILSYSAFTLSFAISLYYVYAEWRDRSLDPSLKRNGKVYPLGLNRLESFNAWFIRGGVVLLGLCIITGAIWAKSAWGAFWSWDPKETWALITFMIYGSVITMREVLKLSSRWQAYFSILGFIVVLLTFFGVNLFFSSHHAYKEVICPPR